MIIGMGTGRCGTQTFAKMFNLPHEKHSFYITGKWESDVSPVYINFVDNINEVVDDVKFVCLQRNRYDTVRSIHNNSSMSYQEACKYYDKYYKKAKFYELSMKNFIIYQMDDLKTPEKLEEFIGKKSKSVEPITNVCNFMRSL